MDCVSKGLNPEINNIKDVEDLLRTCYGLTAISWKPLNSYKDCNYLVEVSNEHTNDHIEQISPHGYLVKIFNASDSKRPNYVLGQKLAMDHLNAAGINCQEEIKTMDGQFFSELSTENNGFCFSHRPYMVSVRTFLPGVILNSITLTKPLAYDVGCWAAKICKAFQGFKFPFLDTVMPLWSMDNFMRVKTVLHCVTNQSQKQASVEILEAFESTVIPRKGGFRKGQIHGDLNEQNILVRSTASGLRVCGVLDYQDTTFSYCIYDLALAIAYLMMVEHSEVSTVEVGGYVLAGYEAIVHLNQAEKESLKTLAAARMVMSLVYGAYFHSLDTSNEYLLTTSKVGWARLFEFWKTPEDSVWETWNEIIVKHCNGKMDIL